MMSPYKQKFKKEYSFELLRIAIGDLESAKGLFEINKGRPENIIYHIEQSIEKCIKAVLCFQGKEVLLTHDLEQLLNQLDGTNKPPEHHRYGSLSQYASIRRYEEGVEEIQKSDVEILLTLGEKVIAWSQSFLKTSS